MRKVEAHLGQVKESLGYGNDILHLTNGINALLYGLCMLSTSTVKDFLDTLNVALCPLAVRLTRKLRTKN